MSSDPHRPYTLSDFDFALPPELIAQHPSPERSASRLLDGRTDRPVDRVFRELPALLAPGDLLVFNDTRVIKARLIGEKPTGGAVEALVERVTTYGFDARIELTPGEGDPLTIQLTRERLEQLEVEQGQIVWVQAVAERTFA